MFSVPAISAAAASASSWLRPPLPFPVSRTTVSPPRIKARGVPQDAFSRASAPRRAPTSRATPCSQSVRISGVYPRSRQAFAAAAHSSRTLPVTRTVTLSAVFGVSCARSLHAASLSRRAYFSATASASAHVDESGDTGPEAIISTGSPTMSLNITANTCAGAQ